MKILSIDTTSEQGSIALIEDGHAIEEVTMRSPDGFAHVVLGEIQKLLERHGVALAAMDAFASASGPGTFTGVRVGLTLVKGLAEACGRPVVAVSNLRALASFGTAELRAPVIDARRGEIYGAVYNAALEPVQDEVVAKLDAWKAGLPEGAEIVDQPRPLAAAMGKIAARELAEGRGRRPEEIDANYVRRSDAELLWRDVR